jgi:hypothetical protein
MGKRLSSIDLLISAVLKLDPRSSERRNVFAFIQSCYGGRVLTYDLGTALASLAKLSEDEQHALIVWVLVNEETVGRTTELAKKPYRHLAG